MPDVEELTVTQATESLKAAIQRVHTAQRRLGECQVVLRDATEKEHAAYQALDIELTVRGEALQALDRALSISGTRFA